MMNFHTKGLKPLARGKLSYCICCALLITACGGGGGSSKKPLPKVPGGVVSQQVSASQESIYLEMRDGVRIAIDVFLPQREKDAKIPTIMRGTRYWRMENSLEGYTLGDSDDYTERGYAFVTVDARGSGASFGSRNGPFLDDEAKDYDEVISWIVAQDWSNGKVGTFGHSYEGTTALTALEQKNPALKVVLPFFADDSLYRAMVYPGGVYQQRFVEDWITANEYADMNEICGYQMLSDEECEYTKNNIADGVKPVDEDTDGSLLEAAIKEHEDNAKLIPQIRAAQYIDSKLSEHVSYRDMSPIKNKENIEASGTPIISALGWLDSATALASIDRFNTYSNPQIMVIAPWGHGMDLVADPYNQMDGLVYEDTDFDFVFDIFDRVLTNEERITGKEIRYLTFNDVWTDDNQPNWKVTTQWPPADVAEQTWYFNPQGSLSTVAEVDQVGVDSYQVDYTTDTGAASRWQAQQAGDPIDVEYGDRAEEDEKLLTFTSEPLLQDVEITGDVIVDIQMTSTHEDGAIFVYLEDVAPDGKVTYITEGLLRLIHRKIGDASQDDYVINRPYHSFKEEDIMPVVPGEIMNITFAMMPTSVMIKAGHRIRIAIAGHDATSFSPLPANTDVPPTYQILRNEYFKSSVRLPIVQ